MATEKHKIQPAGRHLLTIGKDLIQDQFAAIVELVKNAYDADASYVDILFCSKNSEPTIVITDDGHGMTKDVVINKWFVPSTDDKLIRKKSPNGRNMQGRKGVGRYAASILGKNLNLKTVTESGEKTTLTIDWDEFNNAKFLSDVDILVDSEISKEKMGTSLTIQADLSNVLTWDKKQFDKLKFELKKMISPFSENINSSDENFRIFLTIENFSYSIEPTEREQIEPYPIVNLFDYKISGSVTKEGKVSLTYTNQKAKNTIVEKINIQLSEETGCGNLLFDFRVYDRDAEAIDHLIKRGLKDQEGRYLGKLQARYLLNEYNGIGVYRNGFRIRPLGDAEYDWLKLNDQRVQNPSMRVGINQIIGYSIIEPEELSNLEEKSARDGLKENKAYNRLKEISKIILAELEERRFNYRRKEGLGKKAIKLEKELQKLLEFDDLKEKIRKKLKKEGVESSLTTEIISDIEASAAEKNKIIMDVKDAVAIYQGQATLGKIINVILHEGRRPLNYFKNQIPSLKFWSDEFKKDFKVEYLEEINPILNGIENNTEIFVKLFGRLDPLAAGKRGKKKTFVIYEKLNEIKNVFENEIIDAKIEFIIDGDKDCKFNGWEQDFYAIFTNLIDNSIYWIKEKNPIIKRIEIDISTQENELEYIDYRDTGPGIQEHLIEDQIIFDPEFSTKKNGNGLGLAISGEAATRNLLELKAYSSDNGAYFRLQQLNKEKMDEQS